MKPVLVGRHYRSEGEVKSVNANSVKVAGAIIDDETKEQFTACIARISLVTISRFASLLGVKEIDPAFAKFFV